MTCRLYVGAVSTEAVEAAFMTKADVAICASLRQIGPEAYTGMTKSVYEALEKKLSTRYDKKHVHLERDHLGRDQMTDEWLKSDGPVWNQYKFDKQIFDAVHIHSFNLGLALRTIVPMTHHLVDWQIGPGEDDSHECVCGDLSDYANAYTGWVSQPMGPLIDAIGNRSELDLHAIESLRYHFPKAKIRAHACDYLPRRTLGAIKKLVDGINVAPQIGVFQSLMYMEMNCVHGRSIAAWQAACLTDEEQLKRWNLSHWNWYGIGHYHFDKIAWRDDVRADVVRGIAEFMEILDAA